MPEVVVAGSGPDVAALRCGSCGALDPGPRELCPVCGCEEMQACTVPGRGTLVSWTVIRRPPTKFKGEGAYAIAIVDLASGLRVTGRLAAVPESIEPGAAVHAIAFRNGATIFEETHA